MPALAVMCSKELNKDNIVPDNSTAKLHGSYVHALAEKTPEIGEMVAVWDVTWSEDTATRMTLSIPDEIWVMTAGGPVQIDLRHTTFNGM